MALKREIADLRRRIRNILIRVLARLYLLKHLPVLISPPINKNRNPTGNRTHPCHMVCEVDIIAPRHAPNVTLCVRWTWHLATHPMMCEVDTMAPQPPTPCHMMCEVDTMAPRPPTPCHNTCIEAYFGITCSFFPSDHCLIVKCFHYSTENGLCVFIT